MHCGIWLVADTVLGTTLDTHTRVGVFYIHITREHPVAIQRRLRTSIDRVAFTRGKINTVVRLASKVLYLHWSSHVLCNVCFVVQQAQAAGCTHKARTMLLHGMEQCPLLGIKDNNFVCACL